MSLQTPPELGQDMNDLGRVNPNVGTRNVLPSTDMTQSANQDFLRTADEMTQLLCWEVSEFPELSAWQNYDWLNPLDES